MPKDNDEKMKLYMAEATRFAAKHDTELKALLNNYELFLQSYSSSHPGNALAKEKMEIVRQAKNYFSMYEQSYPGQQHKKILEFLDKNAHVLSKPVSAGDGFFAKIRQAIFEFMHPEKRSRATAMIDHFKSVVDEQKAVIDSKGLSAVKEAYDAERRQEVLGDRKDESHPVLPDPPTRSPK